MTKRHAILARSAPALLLLAAMTSAAAAHGVINMYDRGQTIILEGTVIDYQWTTPHIWIDIATHAPDGRSQTWGIEGGGATKMLMIGWTRHTLAPGDRVSVTVNPLKTGQRGGHLISLRLADGTVLNAAGGGGLPSKPRP